MNCEWKDFFEKWKSEEKFNFAPDGMLGQFVPDGIVCEEEFCTSEKKVLFLLKDTNCNPNEDGVIEELYGENGICDEVLQSTTSNNTWLPIAAWTRALLTDCDYKPHQDILREEEAKKFLKKIAIMNIKKAAGKGSVEDNKIREVAKEHSAYIKDEIKRIDPDIIIACSSVIFCAMINKVIGKKIQWKNCSQIDFYNPTKSTYGHYYDLKDDLEMDKSVYLVEYWHPAYTYPGKSCTEEQHFSNFKNIRKEFMM